MQTTTQTTEYFHVRCPCCFKLYSVRHFDILTENPEFHCRSCKSDFWFPYTPDHRHLNHIIAFAKPSESASKKNERHPLQEPFQCEKCGQFYSGGQKECQKCLVVFNKKTIMSNDLSASNELKELWEDVLLNYENSAYHDRFIRYGIADNNIHYVTTKYSTLIEANPSDSRALEAIKKIKALSIIKAESHSLKKDRFWYDWTIPRIKWTPFFYVLSGLLITVGFLLPDVRNLVGFGSSLLFTVLALNYYFVARS